MKKVIKNWLFWTIAIPVAISLLGSLGQKLERDRGHDSKAAKGVRAVRGAVRKVA
jgi:hypothetical protein